MSSKNKKSRSASAKSQKQRSGNTKKSRQPPKRWRPLIWGILALTAIVYIPVFSNGFTNWDDILYVTENGMIRSLSWDNIKAIFTTPLVSNYHPLTVLSFMFNYQVFGLEAWGYHLTNLTIHLLNVFLVYIFILKLSKQNEFVAILTAALFALHPMHVESVAWASERKDVLYTLFFLGGLITYLKYLDSRARKHILWTFGLFILSLLSKPAAVVFPVVLLLIDYFEKRKLTSYAILEKTPFFILSLAFGIIAFMIQSEKAVASIDTYSFLDRIQFAGYGFSWYILKFFIPTGLSALHPYPLNGPDWSYLLFGVSSLGIIGFTLYKKSRLWIFSLGFYLVTIALVLQVISIGHAVVAERYSYVPYIGLAFLLGSLLDSKFSKSKAIIRKIVLAVLTAILLVFVGISHQRTKFWKDSEILWHDALEKYPTAHRASFNLALHHYASKNYDKALEWLNKSIEMKEHFARGIEWRGKTQFALKNYKAAFDDAKKYTEYFPNNWSGYYDMGRAAAQLGDANAAIAAYTESLNKNYLMPQTYNGRGVMYFNKLKDYQKAKADFLEAIKLSPGKGEYYINLARCEFMMGNKEEAIRLAQQGQSLGGIIDQNLARALQQ